MNFIPGDRSSRGPFGRKLLCYLAFLIRIRGLEYEYKQAFFIRKRALEVQWVFSHLLIKIFRNRES